MPLIGFAAVTPQLAPPGLPGICTEPLNDGGVYLPSLREFRICSLIKACSSAERYGLTSSTVNLSETNGGGCEGKGCVGEECSPGTSLCGTGRSTIGQIGLPVSRSKTYRNPFLPACATTSTLLPFCLIVVSCGAAAKS